MLLVAISLAAVTQSVDFNTPSDLSTLFNNPYPDDVINQVSNGIGNSGAVSMPYLPMYNTRTITYKTGFHISKMNEPIIVTADINDATNGGWAGMGISSAAVNESAEMCHIVNTPAMGMQFYSSGASFFSNMEEQSGGTYYPDIPFSWYKVVFTIIPRAGEVYDVSYQLLRMSSLGVIQETTKTGSASFSNAELNDGLVYPYLVIDGHRVTYIDNFSITYPDEDTLPVTMSSFTATAFSQTLINLQWTTESESNILGFNVYRSDDSEIAHAMKINPSFIDGTNTSTQHTYRYADSEFEPNSTYFYWVESTELDNSSHLYGPASVTIGNIGNVVPPTDVQIITGIVSVFPNPFAPSTDIAYQLKDSAQVTLNIYNQRGQLIRSLVNATKDGGRFQIAWDGKDNHGTPCSSGLYIARMQASGMNSYYKMTLVK